MELVPFAMDPTPVDLAQNLFYLRLCRLVSGFEPAAAASTAPARNAGKVRNSGVDSEVWRRAKAGDAAAQEVVVASLAPRLLRLALSLGLAATDAEELAEEALYRGMTRLDSLRRVEAAMAWFRRILVNLWRDRQRRLLSRRELSLDEVPEPESTQETQPETRMATAELRAEISRAIAGLPTEQRLVLALHVEEGLSVAEIAEVTGARPTCVKANLYHARQKLRRWLRARLGEGGA